MTKRLTKPEMLLALADNDNVLFDELKRLFLRLMPEQVKSLELTFAAGDTQTSLALLHKIKGSLQLVGAECTIYDLEQISSDTRCIGELPAKPRLNKLSSQLRHVINEVSQFESRSNPENPTS